MKRKLLLVLVLQILLPATTHTHTIPVRYSLKSEKQMVAMDMKNKRLFSKIQHKKILDAMAQHYKTSMKTHLVMKENPVIEDANRTIRIEYGFDRTGPLFEAAIYNPLLLL